MWIFRHSRLFTWQLTGEGQRGNPTALSQRSLCSVSGAAVQTPRGFTAIIGMVLATEAGLPVMAAVLARAGLAEFAEAAITLVSEAQYDGPLAETMRNR